MKRFFPPAGESRGIQLYLPDDYYESQERYLVLYTLRGQGVDHIELRMVDLNPLVPGGIDERDLTLAQLFLVWLAATSREALSTKAQVQAVQNFKNAAHYDLKTVKIVPPDGEVTSVANAALKVLDRMAEFYEGFPDSVGEVPAFEREKFVDGDNRYAWKIRREFDGGFVRKGLTLARQRQEEADV